MNIASATPPTEDFPANSTSPETNEIEFVPQQEIFALSIQSKGFLALGFLVLYTIITVVFAWQKREALLVRFGEIQQLSQAEDALMQLDSAIFYAAMEVTNFDASERYAQSPRGHTHYQLLREKYVALAPLLPPPGLDLSAFHATLAAMEENPSTSNIKRFVVELQKNKNDVVQMEARLREKTLALAQDYRAQSDLTILVMLLLGGLGLAVLGMVASFFFSRLSKDLRTLQTRAMDIVQGYRGAPIPITRHDEVGRMMAMVNHMSTVLDAREKELMIARQKYFHQEKMAAIGALAAGVAHEIGNPIAAISGIVQEMSDLQTSGACTPPGKSCMPGLIQEQIKRLAAITREISEFSSPRPVDPEWLDLNALVRSTSSLIHYDKRLRQVTLRTDLDSQLPAVYGVADQLVQVIMNLLINAMDAMEKPDNRTPLVVVSTHEADGFACLTVEDNGQGMEKETTLRAFEAFYTTKPTGKGTGLGLSLCYAIIKEHGGTMNIESTLGKGTRVQVFLPLNEIPGQAMGE